MKERKPAAPKPKASKRLKTLHKRNDKHSFLKEFVKNSEIEEVGKLSGNWLHNKKANFSKPPMNIGSTRRKKGGQQQKKK